MKNIKEKMKRYFKRQNRDYSQGFTLLETLIAITILLLSIVGPMTIASKGYLSAVYARDEITAFYLAQEAVEYVRNVRDTNVLTDCFEGDQCYGQVNKDVWLNSLEPCVKNVGSVGEESCTINVLTNEVAACASGGDCTSPLKFEESTGIYGYEDGVDSKFVRTIKIEEDNESDPDYAKIYVKIKWRSSLLGSDKTFEITEYIYNWLRIN